jgi:hypothetical protein
MKTKSEIIERLNELEKEVQELYKPLPSPTYGTKEYFEIYDEMSRRISLAVQKRNEITALKWVLEKS